MFTLKESVHGMRSIDSSTLTETQQRRVRNFISRAYMDDPAYIAKRGSEPFLQCDSHGYMMIEFWSKNIDRITNYITMLNEFVFNKDAYPWEL